MITTTAKTWIALAAFAAFAGIGTAMGFLDNSSHSQVEPVVPAMASSHPTQESDYYKGYDVFGRPLDGVGGRVMPVVTPG